MPLALSAFLLAAATGCGPETGSPTSPATEPAPALAAAASAPLEFRQISAGNLSTCGVTTDDLAYCWGANSFGNLGERTAMNRRVPTAVVGGLQFKEVREGVTHTCGLTTDGRAYCWGQNDVRQLGDGTAPAGSPTPVAVAGNRRFTQIVWPDLGGSWPAPAHLQAGADETAAGPSASAVGGGLHA